MGVELQQEVGSTYTREEVAALVEESRGEGLLADEEYGRLAGALGFAEKDVTAVLMAAGHPHHRAARARPRPTSRTCAPRPATAGSRWPRTTGR